MRTVTIMATVLVLCHAAAPAAAQVISGVVTDRSTGAAVAGARVTAGYADGDRLGSVETDSAGRFTVRAWRAATFRLDISHAAYQPASVTVRAGLGERVEIAIAVDADVAVLDAIEVHGRSRLQLAAYGLTGFEDRRRWGELIGLGRYLSAEDLESGAGSLHGVLVSVPGLRQESHPTCPSAKMIVVGRSAHSLRSAGRGRGRVDCTGFTPRGTDEGICAVSIFVDGTKLQLLATESIDQAVPLGLVAAIEVYRTPAELPAEYSGFDGRCGAIVIWTKRGG
jgi:hypothetical protein